MARFLGLSLAILVLLMGGFTLLLRLDPLAPPSGGLAMQGLERSQPLPLQFAAGGWMIETLALTALFLLIQGRTGGWLLDGIVTGLIGWTFRGPILVLTVVSWSRLPPEPWWPLALRWLILYLACGVILTMIARGVGLRR